MKKLIHFLNFRIAILVFAIQYLLPMKTIGQPAVSDFNPIPLEIAWNKTTSLIFPEAIKNVDRGSRDILAQKAKGVENILQLKAGKTDFPETNLTVITGDGKLHHFIVNYAAQPAELIIEVGKASQSAPSAKFESAVTESQLASYANSIISATKNGKVAGSSKYKIALFLRDIYIRDNTIFYHLHLRNRSNIDYDINFLKFYIRDKKRLKRTATQEQEVKPVFVHGDDAAIKANAQADVVYALEKFTIPDARQLIIELYENNGGRNLDLVVKNRKIMKAKALPETN